MRKLFEEWYIKNANDPFAVIVLSSYDLKDKEKYFGLNIQKQYEAFCAGYQQALELGGMPPDKI